MRRSPRRWTPQEDTILLQECMQLFSEAKNTDTTISWSNVSNAIPNRNNKDCRKRWSKLVGVKKGLWAMREDERLVEGVKKYGNQWALVAKTVETRNSDQCAKRWQHCLDPSLDRSEWTNQKDAQLIAAVERHGKNWKHIKKFHFPMRSTTNLNNRHIALLRQNKKKPIVYPNEAEALLLSVEKEIADNIIIDGSDDGEYLESDHNESSHTSTSTSPFQNNFTAERSPSSSLVTDTTSTSAGSGPYHFHLDWELPSHLDHAQTATPYYKPFENSLGSTFNHATDKESALWKDIDDYEPYALEFPTLTMSPTLTQQENLNILQISNGMKSAQASQQVSNRQPQSVASHIPSSGTQVVLTIENPDPQMMTSILEVLTKAKSKVAISINS